MASTLCQATSQHGGLARTATPEAEAEEAGICAADHEGVGVEGEELGPYIPREGRGAQPLLVRI